MPFSEKSTLKDERRPLLRDPVWHYNHRYGRARGYDPEEVDELFGRGSTRSQRFHWILFLGVTFLSILILLATMGLLIKLSQTHPAMEPKVPTTTSFPISRMPVTASSTEQIITSTSNGILTKMLNTTVNVKGTASLNTTQN